MTHLRRLALGLVLALAFLALALPAVALADAVDDAFAEGNQAAARGEWSEAVDHYEDARALLRKPNATLAYNLGTAYAQLGDLGRATYYLRQAMDVEAGATAGVVEPARQNLEEVRRRAELAAASSGAQIDRPATWWDLFLDALHGAWVGWTALVAGAAFLVSLFMERRRQAHGLPRGIVQGVAVATFLVYVLVGGLHGVALRAQAIAPEAIVLGDRALARARPGAHAPEAMTLQGGARVRVVDRAPGWLQVRLPGGLTGWLPADGVGVLGQGGRVARMPTARHPSSQR